MKTHNTLKSPMATPKPPLWRAVPSKNWCGTPGSNRNRGTIYLIVLATMVLCGVIASAGLIVSGVAADRVRDTAKATRARVLAQSGIELASATMKQNMTWRTSVPVGGVLSTSTLDGGTITLTLADKGDGQLANSSDDSITVTSEAQIGSARKLDQATFVPNTAPAPMLAYGLMTGGTLALGATSNIWSNATIAANDVTLSASTITAPVVAATTASGSTYAGTVQTGQTLPAIPTAATIIAEYVAMGTSINVGNGTITIDRIILSPTSNPLGGGTNAKGVYVIDCAGNTVTIKRSRINATLVLRNPGNGSRVMNSVCWDPATTGYPSLIVEGSLDIGTAGIDLSEATEGTNFNPSGSPYARSSNATMIDTYPSEFTGLIYVSGKLTITGTVATAAPIISAGGVTLTG
ncbi:hypothetical protein D4Q85_00045, partial [bacterium]